MRRFLSAGWCLFMGLGWAHSAEASPAVQEAEARETPTVGLWVAPPLLLPMAALDWSVRGHILMLPLGLSVPLGPRRDLVVELTPLYQGEYQSDPCEGDCHSQALSLAVGMSWSASPERSRGGAFVELKLIGVVENDSVDRYLWNSSEGYEKWSATGGQLSVGVDVGYRFPTQHLLLEFVLGGSVGRGWNVPRSSTSAFTSFLLAPERERADKWVWDVNPSLVRIGGRF